MYEKYIARRETVENIVSAVLQNGASRAFDTMEEVRAYQEAWESLSTEEQSTLRIMCNRRINKMTRVREAERTLHLTQSMPYKLKRKALDKLGNMLFE